MRRGEYLRTFGIERACRRGVRLGRPFVRLEVLMPKDGDFKALVRARMAVTGERYTEARARLDTRRQEPERQEWRWVLALAEPQGYHQAYGILRSLPPASLRPLVVEGTRHENWRVRRGCCRLLDDLEFTEASLAALRACLDDPVPQVRRAAVHALACQHCKPEGCVVDVRPVFERALRDPNRRVRQMAVGPLTYGADEPWRLEMLQRVAEADPSAELRRWAAGGLRHFEEMRRSEAERLALPDELRAKTERHPGKWVAVSGGLVIDAGGHPDAMRRAALRHGHDDVRLYWVSPADATEPPTNS